METRYLYEIFKVLKIQKRIVSAETIRGNTVCHRTCPRTVSTGQQEEWLSVNRNEGREAPFKKISKIHGSPNIYNFEAKFMFNLK